MQLNRIIINKNNNNIKKVSVASFVIAVCHIIHVFFLSSAEPEPIPFNGKSTIVFHDSLGKLDTMDLETYIKQQEKK